MGSVEIPNPPPPFNPFKDCSQEICSVYCPPWCYIIFTPPPPLSGFDDAGGDSSTYFSPLIVAVIGILASAFILVTYYAVVSKFCRRRGGRGDGGGIGSGQSFEMDHGRRPGTPPGLDEALIKSISVYKYKKGDGLVDGTDCSVCLSEFQEDENLKLLPKCSHAFHLACIDTWLKTNSSCPLCRCSIAQINPPSPAAPAVSARGYRRSRGASVVMVQDLPDDVTQQAVVVEIAGDEAPANHEHDDDGGRPSERAVSVGDILSVDEEAVAAVESPAGAEIGGSDGDGIKEQWKSRNRSAVGNLAMKKSISSGILGFTRYGKGKCSNLPN